MQWKYPKKELLWSQLLLFFHLLKHYAVSQWCISWKQWQISNREIKLAVFPVFICSDQSEKTIALFFFARKLLKTCLGGFSVGFWCWPTVYNEYILLKFEIWDGSHLLLIISVILSVNFFTITFKTIFLLFSHVFHKRMYKLCVT